MLNTLLRPATLAMAFCLSAGAALSPAQAITITREFSANWYDPSRSGHGFGLEVIEAGSEKRLVAYWFTHDLSGRPMWLVGNGPIVGSRASVQVFSSEGGRFTNDFNPANVQVRPWGSLEFSFTSCSEGSVEFRPQDPQLPAGSMPLKRLTSLYGGSCTGGISDDRRSHSADERIVQFLENSGAFPAASGKLSFEQRSERTDFEIEVERLPPGPYALRVDGTQVAQLQVSLVNGVGRAELELRSPSEPGHPLLTFDPRGKRVEILEGARVVLTAAQFTGSPNSGGNNGGNPPISGAPPFGNDLYRLQVELFNDGPEMEVELERRANRIDFKVELEDVAVGSYTLTVGGTQRGSLQVVSVPGGTEGELELRFPPDTTHGLLDFDPRGQLIQLSGPGGFQISGVLPSTPSVGDDD
jgi:hypothetical protein